MSARFRAVAVCALVFAASAASATATPGRVVYLEGEVTVNRAAARVGQEVPAGATVRTGPASVCEISWGDRNIIQVQQATVVVLQTARLSPGLWLREGSIAAVLNKLDGITGRDGFRVRTPSAVAGVRGTVFFVKVEDAANTYVCACNGAVDVSRGARLEAELASGRHMARRFTRDGLATRVTSPGLLYHDDALMDGLARKIGYAVPWGTAPYGAPAPGGYGY